ANASWLPDEPPSKPKHSKHLTPNWPMSTNWPQQQPGSLTASGSSGSPTDNAQHVMKQPSATPWPLATASKPKANPSKTTKSSTPTNAPITSPKPLEPTIANQTSHPCATASPWPAAYEPMSLKASPTQTTLTAVLNSPVPDAKP